MYGPKFSHHDYKTSNAVKFTYLPVLVYKSTKLKNRQVLHMSEGSNFRKHFNILRSRYIQLWKHVTKNNDDFFTRTNYMFWIPPRSPPPPSKQWLCRGVQNEKIQNVNFVGNSWKVRRGHTIFVLAAFHCFLRNSLNFFHENISIEVPANGYPSSTVDGNRAPLMRP